MMKNYLFLGSLLLTLLFFQSAGLTGQSEVQDRNNVAFRYVLPNYILPLSTVPPNLGGRSSFGGGLELEYQRRLASNILLGIPLRLSSADAIRNNSVDLSQPALALRDVSRLDVFGGDLLLMIEPIARRSFFDPQFFAGIGMFTRSFLATTLEVPLGVNLNFRLSDGMYFNPQVSYRLALDSDDGDIRNNLQLGFGLHLMLDKGTPPPPPAPLDTDGDGLPDSADQCPTEAGPLNLLGCPDKDGDGLADKNDKCPDVAGPATMMGCPDTDGDGITDADDDCPDVAGPASNKGCPITDRDGDGTPDADDRCPDVAGPISNNGCPVADRDGDGVPDATDRCPDAAGPAADQGCPDRDSDTVVDPDDRCPDVAGSPTNRGCPELAKEDKETIEFAIQNINFETGSDRLTASSRGVLDRVQDIMNRYPAYQLSIGGHTDSVGSEATNQVLSEKRAKSVLEYLAAAGISRSRMDAQGFGESKPIADNINAAGREQNRRVTLDLVVN